MLVIGLTGGFGCGKSTIRELLHEFDDVSAFDCDASAKRILDSLDFRPVAESILGADCFPNDTLDRKLIAEKFFRDPSVKTKLEAALFPSVLNEMFQIETRAAAHNQKFFVVETAILFNTGMDKRCDVTICVLCPDTVRRERLKANRGYSDDEITERLKHQLTDAELANLSDISLSTDCQMDELKARVRALHTHLAKLYAINERNRLA